MIPRVRLKDESRRRPSEVFRKAAASPRRSSGSRIGDRALIAVFVVMICVPLVGADPRLRSSVSCSKRTGTWPHGPS